MKFPFITALLFGGSKEQRHLVAEVAMLKGDVARLENILAERDRLITELRSALESPRRMPFVSVDGGSDTTEYERGEPSWL